MYEMHSALFLKIGCYKMQTAELLLRIVPTFGFGMKKQMYRRAPIDMPAWSLSLYIIRTKTEQSTRFTLAMSQWHMHARHYNWRDMTGATR
jgi:hypothetical protein